MASILTGKRTALPERDLVVFLIGARINKWWLLPLALPILAKMRKMQLELLADPDSGLLGFQSLGGADVQYWRSIEDLMVYAEARNREHKPAAKKFYQKLFKNQAVGVWHETYVVASGQYENMYINMPAFGLGKVLPLLEAKDQLATAQGRLAHRRRKQHAA